jgi:uncharacterized protein YaiL (DUF2058 family)
MGSLADQLLKAGLADKGKVQKVEAEKRRKNKKKQKGQKVVDEVQLQVKQAEAERLQRDRELNRQQHEARLKKEAQARIKQIIEQYAIADIDGDQEFNFVVEGKVKKMFITDPLRRGLVRGSLSICALYDGYVLIPSTIAVKLQDIDSSVVIPLGDSTQEEALGEDDPYADYQVPDDLMW